MSVMLCPADGKPCCDDLCHGGGCMSMGGYGMLERCYRCNGTIDNEIPECSSCTCEDGPNGVYWDDADYDASEASPAK
jgi:hypothetical protein